MDSCVQLAESKAISPLTYSCILVCSSKLDKKRHNFSVAKPGELNAGRYLFQFEALRIREEFVTVSTS